MIDRVAFARRRVAALDKDPDAAVSHAVDAILQLAGVAAELLLVPGERRRRIGRAQVDVVQPELLRVLHHFDPRAPRIVDERELEEAGHVARRVDDLRAGRFEILQRRVEVGDREADVIERAAGARLRLVVLEEDQARVAEHQPVGRFRDRLPAERLLIPLDALRLIGDVQVDVIDDRHHRRLRGGGRRKQDYADRRNEAPSHVTPSSRPS